VLDPDEWSADVAELVCQRSAVIRLGATVVSDEYELHAPAIDSTPRAPDYVKEGGEKPILKRRELTLRPRDHELAAKVVLPDRVARDTAADPLLALAVKEDLAEALALRADRAFLSGAGPAPVGVAGLVPGVGAQADILSTGRALLTQIRTVDPLLNPAFRAPGWVLHPATLDALVQEKARPSSTTVETVDIVSGGLLCLDGADGGEFLGYPFVVSAAAFDAGSRRMYFSADWRQAWIAVDGVLVDVDISGDVHFQTDETVIRATMCHDFGLARPEAFTWSAKDGSGSRKKARSSG
jgi:HK97 family phage major capsid protein